jgi:glycosyltransferase involved in cell wall biosynthesis
MPVIWTHIGNGPLFEEIKSACNFLPENVKVNFKGRLTQELVFTFYSSTPVDFFINCSISEGLPVSIMEAISFGIPVVATNVGGTSEIVNPLTGFLLDSKFETRRVAQMLVTLKNSDIAALRKSARLFWKQNFDSPQNYSRFVSELLQC